jgi:hypothetical protein
MRTKPKKGIVKRGVWEITKKLLKAIPVIGPVFTVGFAGHDIKKKGLVPGAVHVGLDVTPVVGTAKNVVEIFTGDWIPDKASKTPQIISQPAGASLPSQPERLSDSPAESRAENLPTKD